jgi:hypothetical protein
MVLQEMVILDRRQLCYTGDVELFLITFNIVVSVIGFSFIAWSQRDTRQILRELKELMERMDANSSQIAEHSRHIAELVVQNGSALARVETLTQQILTRMADEQTAH